MEFRPNPLLYGASGDFYSTFKLVVTMKDPVDYPILQKAVHSAMKRYPYFSVCPQKTGNTLRLQLNQAPVPVFPHGRCVVLGGEECHGHLLAFGCEERKILLHASHFIADGMGITPLLMTVLFLYISEKYGPEGINPKGISLPDDPVREEEYAYPFPEEPVDLKGEEEKKPSEKQVYSLDPNAFDDKGLYTYHLRIPQKEMMQVANPSDGSPVSFLSVTLFRALCQLEPELSQRVVGHVQHQYRAALNVPMNRHSLVSYIPVSFSPALNNRPVELQNTVIRGQIILGSEQEQDLYAVNRLCSVFKKSNAQSFEEKQQAMKEYVANSIGGKTFGISYVGKMDWRGMDRYLEDFHAYIGEKTTPNMLLIEVMTVGEDFSLNVMQSGKGTRYVDAFMEQLERLGIPVGLAGEERYTLCDTKLSY